MTTYLATSDRKITEGRCIFCQTQDQMTGEHLFAHWTTKATTPNNRSHVTLTLTRMGEKEIEVIDLTGFRSDRNVGHVNLRLTILCKECNNGWGSDIQGEASKVLKPILDGSAWLLSGPQRKIVARWITAFLMVRQYLHPELKTIDDDVCFEFFKSREPMKGLSIWIAKYNGDNTHECRYRALGAADESVAPEFIGMNTCCSTLVIGSLIFFVFWSSEPNAIKLFSTEDPGPYFLLNQYAHENGRRSWIENPENIRDPSKGYSGPAEYPLHDMLAELGMTQVWPTFEKYSNQSRSTLTRKEYSTLNEMATHVIQTYDSTLANAKSAVQENKG
ncbi:hypothetical protein LPN04_07385 [Rugamonas sp. A1-17]|nr:hypothetical protein [Rugamonas sp. A1-17]